MSVKTFMKKDAVNQLLGESNGISIINKVGYIGGVEPADKYISARIYNSERMAIIFGIRPKGLEITFIQGFSKERVALLHEQIINWSIEKQSEIMVNKSKSVVGRALVGGLLLGPVGAIVGGMTGIGEKTVNTNHVENVLSIKIAVDGEESMLLFSCKNINLSDVNKFFTEHFRDKYLDPSKIETSNSLPPSFSVADEIIKLKKLMDEGILTKEEFETQKLKLLST